MIVGEQTEAIKIQQQRWAVLSTVVQAQVAIVATAWVAYANSTDTASLISAIVATVGAIMTVIGRFAAQGGLTWKKPPSRQLAEIQLATTVKGLRKTYTGDKE